MPIITQYELKKLKRIAAESVRRDVEFGDWLAEYVPLLVDRGETQLAATAICSKIWRDACEEDQGVKL